MSVVSCRFPQIPLQRLVADSYGETCVMDFGLNPFQSKTIAAAQCIMIGCATCVVHRCLCILFYFEFYLTVFIYPASAAKHNKTA